LPALKLLRVVPELLRRGLLRYSRTLPALKLLRVPHGVLVDGATHHGVTLRLRDA
jgi:hypothetical protein